jgi:hypothetical protein
VLRKEPSRLRLREITADDVGWYLEHFSRPEIVHGQASRRQPTETPR